MNRILVTGRGERGAVLRCGDAESHHLLRVQRVARGSVVWASDGAGWAAECELLGVEEGVAVLRVLEHVKGERELQRVVILGMPKGPALEEALILGTEAGVTRFVLVTAERSVRAPMRWERVGRVVQSAVTQCGRARMPEIVEAKLERVLEAPGGLPEVRWLADRSGTEEPPLYSPSAVVAIGPEGGWSPTEAAVFQTLGFRRLRFGHHILRTPTAVAVAMGRLWA